MLDMVFSIIQVRSPGVLGLRGVIKGSGILCFCGDCNGNEVSFFFFLAQFGIIFN